MLILGGVGTVVARLASAEKDIAALLAWKALRDGDAQRLAVAERELLALTVWKALREKDPERLATLEAQVKPRPHGSG